MNDARPERWQRKGTTVLAALAGALLAFGTTTQTWLTVQLPTAAVRTPDLRIVGSDAAASVTALALAALAAALAAAVAGRVGRLVSCLAMLLAGLGISAVSLAVIADPAAAAAGPVGAATGVLGKPADTALTPFPGIAAAAGLIVALCSVWLYLAGRSWTRTRRFEQQSSPNAAPSKPAAETSTENSTQASTESQDRIDEIDGWDQLSRGQDPTR